LFVRFFQSLFPVRQGERRLTLLLLFHNLFAVGAFTSGRTVRDALFLVHADRAQLPWMYVASAAAVALVGVVYGPLAGRLRRDRMAVASALLFAGLYLVIWLAERSAFPFVYHLLYVYVEVMGALTLVQFWTLANDLFHAREAKRLYGFIGAGGMAANIVVGFLTAKVAKGLGASAILILSALLLLGTAASSFLAGRWGRQRMFARAATGPSKGRISGGASRVMGSAHLRMVAVLTALTFITTSIVDFQFKVIAGESFPVDQLAAFFGYFYSGVGVLALGLQLFGTGRILSRVGVIGALSVLPLALGGGSLVLALLPVLWSAAMVKGADNLFRYSINDATSQILYLPVSPNARASAKAFIDSVVKPVSIGVAGLALLGYRAVFGGDPWTLAWVAVALCAVWLGVVLALRSRYVRSLQDNLRHRRLDLESAPYRVQDGAAIRVLTRALESGDPREVLNALELLPHLEDLTHDHRVEALLEHELPTIRIAALDYYKRREAVRFANSIFRRFEDPEPSVRAAAVDAFCSIGKDRAVRSVKTFLKDPDPAVRSAAVTGMIRYGGLDGILMAAEALKQLISHPDAVMRLYAAKVLGAVGVSNFYQPVLELMNDPEAPVRREAIAAAGILKSPEFVVPLIYKTRSAETGREAVEALSQFGPRIVPTLGKVLQNRLEAQPIRCAVAKVLGRLATAEAAQLLCRGLDEPDEELRTQLYRSLSRAVRTQRVPVDRVAVLSALDREFLRAYHALHVAQTLRLPNGPGPLTPRRGPEPAAALLGSALLEKVAATERRIFTLLAVLYPEAEMERIHAGIRDASSEDAPRRRATAVELLDNLLDRDLKRKLLPLSDDVPRGEKLKAVQDVVPPASTSAVHLLEDLCHDETPWIRACALYYATETGLEGLQDSATAALLDSSPVVRETALLCCARARPDGAAALAESRLTDEAPIVRQQAALIATRRLQAAGS
jgi:AAA family ATP:ADP antiporter